MSHFCRDSMTNLLHECCANMEQAYVTFPDVGTACRGQFVGIHENQVEIELSPSADTTFYASSLCVVTFQRSFQPHAFLSHASGQQAGRRPGTILLRVEMPEKVISEWRRSAFRVPISAEAGLQVKVTCRDGRIWPAKAIDMSVTGMLLEFSRGETFDGPGGGEFDVTLTLDEQTVTLRGEVMRCDRDRRGIYFPEVASGGKLDPPLALQAIAKTVQDHWFRQFCENTSMDDQTTCDRPRELIRT